MKKILVFITFALLLTAIGLLWLTQNHTTQDAQLPVSDVPPASGSAVPVGGPFTLTDQHGAVVTDQQFRGRLMLVFFGFTHCPDVCPVTVSTLSNVMKLLGTQADQVAPVFISVDPERDTPGVLKDFLAAADARMIGLTGSTEQITQVTQAYKTYFSKMPASNGQDYMVDHSAFIYLMGKDGVYIRLFNYDTPAQDIAAALKSYLN